MERLNRVGVRNTEPTATGSSGRAGSLTQWNAANRGAEVRARARNTVEVPFALCCSKQPPLRREILCGALISVGATRTILQQRIETESSVLTFDLSRKYSRSEV